MPESTAAGDDAAQQATDVVTAMREEILRRPPTIGVVGVSGTGKSSTINALFRTDLPISHTTACTRTFRQLDLAVQATQGPVTGEQQVLRVVDAPGLGEDIRRDASYLAMYRENLPACDVILWVVSARNRALALDQTYLAQLAAYHDRIVFGVNQVDLIAPVNWERGRLNLPSPEQERHLGEILHDRRERLTAALGIARPVVGYSAGRRYRLQELFTELLGACPPHRSFFFSAIKNFRHDDFARRRRNGGRHDHR